MFRFFFFTLIILLLRIFLKDKIQRDNIINLFSALLMRTI